MLVSDFIIVIAALVAFSFIAGFNSYGDLREKLNFSLSLSIVAIFSFCGIFFISYLIALFVRG